MTWAVVISSLLPAGLSAQQTANGVDASSAPTLQQRLIPESTAKLLAPASEVTVAESAEALQPIALQRHGRGTALMIAGGALFIAGLLIGDDAGTVVAVTGAAIGAYGLYLYFR